MIKIEIELPKDAEQRAKMTRAQLAMLASRLLQERLKEMEDVDNFKHSIVKSKLTEKDVEELADKVNTKLWEHHKKKYNL